MPPAAAAATTTDDADTLDADTLDTDIFDPAADVERQLQNLLGLGYPALAGLTDDELTGRVRALTDVAVAHASRLPQPTTERVPLVVVVTRALARPEQTVPLTSLRGKAGSISRLAPDLETFDPVELVGPLPADVYLLVDVERGQEYLNAPPETALPQIAHRGRTPLTIDEGIALVTQWPETLEKNHCFSLAGSRSGDRRVPALWISKKAPLLGWCWNAAPHTWLGTASTAQRCAAK